MTTPTPAPRLLAKAPPLPLRGEGLGEGGFPAFGSAPTLSLPTRGREAIGGGVPLHRKALEKQSRRVRGDRRLLRFRGRMVPVKGLEPPTPSLRMTCSTS